MRVDQVDPRAFRQQAPLLRDSAVTRPQIQRGAAGRPAALNVQALPVDPQGAIRLGYPLLRGGVRARTQNDRGAVSGRVPVVSDAPARDLRYHLAGWERPHLV